jgi:uncharacterized protein (DUF1501 family)
VLIVLGMFGGNDGLNTVVPINDQLYYGQHAELGDPSRDHPADRFGDRAPRRTLRVQTVLGHAGQLAIVEGVGYPEPDLSHFSSMAKWMAGSPTGIPTSGWLGRWLDGYIGGGKNLYAAASIGQSVPLHLVGRDSAGHCGPRRAPLVRRLDGSPVDIKIYEAVRRLGCR